MELDIVDTKGLKYELAIRALSVSDIFAQRKFFTRNLAVRRENNMSDPSCSCYYSGSEVSHRFVSVFSRINS